MTQPNDKQRIIDAVNRFFHAIDTADWTTARALLTDSVEVAHGSDQITLSAEDLTSGWKESHARFQATQYELEPVDVEYINQDQVIARFDSCATFVPSESEEQATLVIDGRYTVSLEQSHNTWNIRSIRHDESGSHYSESDSRI